MSSHFERLLTKIAAKEARMCVVGLGRVGLPFAVAFASKGVRVTGVDVDERRIGEVSRGRPPFYDRTLEQALKDASVRDKLTTTKELKEAVQASDVVVVTVGTPVNASQMPDYSQLSGVLEAVGSTNITGKLITLRSTLSPRTTVDYVIPLLENLTSLREGVDFGVAYCPERILEGRALTELVTLPEIVGAASPGSAEAAGRLFRLLNSEKRILATSPTAAELAKLYTNVYRYVRFALANEFAMWAEMYGESAKEVIEVANADYPRGGIPMPGFAGGPCLGKDGFLLDSGMPFTSIALTAWRFNEAIPQYVATKMKAALGGLVGARVAVLGCSFKAGSDDTRLSPALKLIEALKTYGAEVVVHDPYVKGTQPLSDALKGVDAVVVAVNHPEFTGIEEAIVKAGPRLVYDAWGVLDASKLVGTTYVRLGGVSKA